MKQVLFAVIAAGVVQAAAAQTPGENHADWIQAAKAELHAHGIATEGVGPCGPFQIINLAAYRHKDTGIGVLDKPTGAHCEWPVGSGQFFSSDWLVYPNGAGGDMLIGAETQNGPTWNLNPPDPGLVPRWRAPFEPFADPPPPAPPPTPVPVPPDLSALLARLNNLEGSIDLLRGEIDAVAARLATAETGAAALKARVIGTGCSASVFGVPISCRLTVPAP